MQTGNFKEKTGGMLIVKEESIFWEALLTEKRWPPGAFQTWRIAPEDGNRSFQPDADPMDDYSKLDCKLRRNGIPKWIFSS